ncbi:shikimate 5-dehydrogenase, partial [Xanthomonas translucens DAR61454]
PPRALLGAGGAARGVAPALLDAGVQQLLIVNRSPERADALVDALGDPARAVSRYWEDLREQGDFELIVNATAAGRDDSAGFSLPLSLVNSMTLAVDLNYGEVAIPFLAWARAAHCRDTVDGLGMLVEQAAESFERWHGVRPDTGPVYAALRARDAVLVSAD